MFLTPDFYAKESATRSVIAGVGSCWRFLHVSWRRQHAYHGCFLTQDVLRGALLTVESTPICKRGVHKQHWRRRKSLQLAIAHNIRSLGKSVRIVYGQVYRTLVIKCIFVIKRIVSSCSYYKRMHLTTGVYSIGRLWCNAYVRLFTVCKSCTVCRCMYVHAYWLHCCLWEIDTCTCIIIIIIVLYTCIKTLKTRMG